jgi:hypothetical protein
MNKGTVMFWNAKLFCQLLLMWFWPVAKQKYGLDYSVFIKNFFLILHGKKLSP